MTTQLKNLVIKAVSLVDEGSCSEAHINLIKRKDGEIMNYEELLKSLSEDQRAILVAAMDAKELELEKAKTELAKGCSTKKQKPSGEEGEEEDDDDDMKKADDFTDGAEANGGPKGKKPGKEGDDAIMKSMPEEVRTLIEKANNKAAAAEAMAKRYMEKEVEREAIAKAKSVSNIPYDESEIVKLYKSLNGKDETLTNTVFEILEKAHALIAKSKAFESKGSSSVSNTSDTDSAWAEIEKAAQPIALAKSISKASAISQVMSEQPELYKRYLDAQRAE